MSKREFIMESKKNSRLRWMLGVLCMLYAGSMFADEVVIDGVTYDLDTNSKTAKVYSVSQDAESIVIPQIVVFNENSYTIIELGISFAGYSNLKSVTIEMPMTEIPSYFFEGCTSLASVCLPNEVTSIGNNAFSYCQSLTSLDFLPDGVNAIGDNAFSGCSGLTELTIRKGINYGYDVFLNCSGATSLTIEAIELDETMETLSVGNWGFSALKYVRIEDADTPLNINLPSDAPIEQVYIGRDIDIVNGDDFANVASVKEVTFGEKVTFVPSYIFSGASALSTVTFGNNIKKIGAQAFNGANLTNIALPIGIDTLEAYAFAENVALETINLPASLQYIGSGCFSNTSVKEVVFPEAVTIADGFSSCKSLTRIVIPDNTKEIARSAFSGSKNLSEVVIGKNVSVVNDCAFYECYKLYDVYYNGTLSDWCKMTINTGSYPEDTNPLLAARNFYVKDNGNTYQAITELVIPEDITVIQPFAFAGCRAFTSVTIPESVQKVGESAFEMCRGIKEIYINADTICEYAFFQTSGVNKLTLGKNVKVIARQALELSFSSTTYEGSMQEWLKIKREARSLKCNELTIDGELVVDFSPEQYSMTEVPAYAFYYCTSLKTVHLPYSVKSVGGLAFYSCSNLTEVEARGVTKIEGSAFAYCENLTKANFAPASATRGSDSEAIHIGASAFSGCTKLGEIVLPDNIAYIGSYAFDNTLWFNNLSDGPVYLGSILYTYKGEMPENTTITVKDGTTMICEWAFSSQYNLKGITLPHSIANIGDYAFSYSGLKSFEIPASVDTIPVGLLSNCSNLKSLIIPSGVDFVNSRAFANCDSLESIHIADAETPLVWEGYHLAYTDMHGGMYFPMAPEGWGFPDSYPKNLYLGRDMESPTLVYDMGYGEQEYGMYLPGLFHTDSLKTLTIGKDVTTLNLSTMPLYPEWIEKYEFWGYTTPLREITCLATVPPTFPVDAYGDVRDPFIHPDVDEWAVDFIKAVIPLSVPQEAVEAYKNADVWKGFYQIDGKDFTGIAAVQTETNSGIHYDISGRIVAPDMPGIHIIRNADGSTRKILVR